MNLLISQTARRSAILSFPSRPSTYNVLRGRNPAPISTSKHASLSNVIVCWNVKALAEMNWLEWWSCERKCLPKKKNTTGFNLFPLLETSNSNMCAKEGSKKVTGAVNKGFTDAGGKNYIVKGHGWHWVSIHVHSKSQIIHLIVVGVVVYPEKKILPNLNLQLTIAEFLMTIQSGYYIWCHLNLLWFYRLLVRLFDSSMRNATLSVYWIHGFSSKEKGGNEKKGKSSSSKKPR